MKSLAGTTIRSLMRGLWLSAIRLLSGFLNAAAISPRIFICFLMDTPQGIDMALIPRQYLTPDLCRALAESVSTYDSMLSVGAYSNRAQHIDLQEKRNSLFELLSYLKSERYDL